MSCYDILRLLHYLPFHVVQLVHQTFLTHVEGTARLFVRRTSLLAVVQAPTGSAAGERAVQVGQIISRFGDPIGVPAPERFLIMHRYRASQLLHQVQVFARAWFCFRR